MSKMLFVAPASNLQNQAELVKSLHGQQVTVCDGNVDRSKLEQFLYADQYDYLQFGGHGDLSVLQLSDGALEVQDLLIMLDRQARLSLVVITACFSARVAAEIHNKFHIPVVMCQVEIGDSASGTFTETFWRAYTATKDVQRAVDVARATLAKRDPAYEDVVTLLNGDMSTKEELSGCMDYVQTQMKIMHIKLNGIEKTVNDIKGEQSQARMKQYITIVVIGVSLFFAQILTPWLTHWFASH